jgi:actin-like ATPase involved in cell morphogenesis
VAITHPASYGPYKLDLLQQAARQADVHPVTFMSEPVAAAVHYSDQERIEPGAVVAVYDFGGGTFDAALLRRTSEGFELLGEGEGLERLGGIDFDEAVFAHVVNAIEGRAGALTDATAGAVGRLREECTRAKETLSEDTEATIPVLLPDAQTDVRITRSEFESIIRPRIRETISALERAVRRAGLAMTDVDRILLVGGSSRIPLVAEMVRAATGRPVALDAQPKHAIALGAATMALQSAMDAPSAPPAPTPLPPQPVPEPAGPELVQPPPGPSPAAVPDANATAATRAMPPTPQVEAQAPPPPPPSVPRPTDATPPTVVAPASRPAPQPAEAAAASDPPPPASRPRPQASTPVAVSSSPSASANERDDGSRIRIALFVLGPIIVVLAIIGAFVFLGGDGDGGDDAMADAGATETAEASLTAGAAIVETPTSTSTPTSTAPPTATPTRPPQDAEINNISLSGGRYIVDFSTFGFQPLIGGDFHVHFFFDTVPPIEAGFPGAGPWFVYDVPNPFTEYGVNDRPTGADQMCILVARTNHSVIQDTGNCFDLP